MNEVITRLLEGDTRLPSIFAEAKAFWDKFYEEHWDDDIPTLARALDGAQFRIEDIMKDRDFGKSTMTFTALGSLYDDTMGWEDNKPLAQRVVKAFQTGMTSLEVKHSVERAASLFYLDID